MDIQKIVSDAENCNHIIAHPIESFSVSGLSNLAELAKKRGIKVELHSEHSNFAQGVLVEVYKWPLPWKCGFDNLPIKENKNA